jgi:hypothetical protein
VTISLLLAARLAWGSGVGTTGAASLKVAAGARPAALGGAFVGLADDANALFWNPAGLADVRDRQLGLMYTSYLVDTSYQLVSWAQPMPALGGGVAAAVYTLDYGTITLRDERPDGMYGPATGTTAPREWYVTAGWGTPLPRFFGLDRFRAGASLKITFQPATLGEVMGLGATAGALLDLPVDGLRAGLVADNLGALTSGGGTLPINFRFGASYGRPVSAKVTVTAAADARYFLDVGFRANAGLEVVAFDLVALRGGWASGGVDAALTRAAVTRGAREPITGEGGPTLGLGVRSPAAWGQRHIRFGLDYALTTVGALGSAHRVQLTVSL